MLTAGDERKEYRGNSILLYAVSNNDKESRYAITDYLLNMGAEVNVSTEYGENPLHLLLANTTHNLSQTIELCKRFIEKGVNINQVDIKGRVPLQHLVNLKYSDEDLEPLYQIWFAQKSLLLNHKNVRGKTPIEIAEQMPYREGFLQRVKKYEQND